MNDSPPEPSTDSVWVRFGYVEKAHGVRGELKVVPDARETPFPGSAVLVRLVGRDGSHSTVKVESMRAVHEAVLLRFEGVEDRDRAMALRGSAVEVLAEAIPPAEGDSFYLYEVLGVRVVDETGAVCGVVDGFSDNGAQPLLRLDFEGQERLLPVVEQTMVRLDRQHQELVVRVPEGLWS